MSRQIYLPELLSINIKNYTLYPNGLDYTFEFVKGANLVLGGNGMGKTTFVSRLQWIERIRANWPASMCGKQVLGGGFRRVLAPMFPFTANKTRAYQMKSMNREDLHINLTNDDCAAQP